MTEPFDPLPELDDDSPPKFDERCQSIRGSSSCRRPADLFCLKCHLQLCRECRPHHIILWVRYGALSLLHCDGREYHMGEERPDDLALTY